MRPWQKVAAYSFEPSQRRYLPEGREHTAHGPDWLARDNRTVQLGKSIEGRERQH